MAEAAEYYRIRSLSFTADETVKVLSYRSNSNSPSRYTAPVSVYFYQKDADGQLTDRRMRRSDKKRLEKMLRDSNGASLSIDALPDPMKNSRITEYVVRPYGWILLFSGEIQPFYTYRVVERTRHESRPAVRISFEPNRDPVLEYDWYGTVLVDLETFGLLFAEGIQSGDYEVKRQMTELLESERELPVDVDERTFVVRQVSTEFALEMQGQRFPTEVTTKIYRYIVRGADDDKKLRVKLSTEIIQRFDKYKLYEVHTEQLLRADP